MGIVIRRAGRHDVDALVALWLQFVREQAGSAPAFRPSEDAEQRWRNDLPEWLRDETRRVFVADHDDELVGFATAQRWAPPPVYAFSEEVYLNELYVRPDTRSAGVGLRLVREVEDWAADLGAVQLRVGVAANNDAARGFWQKVGARPLSVTYALECKGSAKKKGGQNNGRRIGF